MATFVRGDVVVVPFPFSDLSQAKRRPACQNRTGRPALVLTELDGDDRILCQITSQSLRDRYAIQLDDNGFAEGSLRQKSNVRPNRIFTADMHIILYRIGRLKADKIGGIIEEVIGILKQQTRK